jgi:hypothetical protein
MLSESDVADNATDSAIVAACAAIDLLAATAEYW